MYQKAQFFYRDVLTKIKDFTTDEQLLEYYLAETPNILVPRYSDRSSEQAQVLWVNEWVQAMWNGDNRRTYVFALEWPVIRINDVETQVTQVVFARESELFLSRKRGRDGDFGEADGLNTRIKMKGNDQKAAGMGMDMEPPDHLEQIGYIVEHFLAGAGKAQHHATEKARHSYL